MAVFHRYILVIALLAFMACAAFAGGGPQNVLIVVNTRSGESLEIGSLYRRARDIPYRQLLALSTSTAPVVPYQTYLNDIEKPIRQYLADEGLAEEITCIVLTRGLPMQVDAQNGRTVASLLAALDLGKGANRTANPYLDKTVAFSHRDEAQRGMFLVTVLNGYHVEDIKRLIAQGKQADGQAPDGRFIFQAVPQLPRASNAAAVDLLILRGLKAEAVNALPDERNGVMGYFSAGIYSGITRDVLAATTFRPGAVVDFAQSYGAAVKNFDDGETPVLLPVSAFVRAGATGVHGVIGEPGLASFPMIASLKTLLDRYTSGFSLAESYYAALPSLNWQNIVLGDPLCTPYAKRPLVNIEASDAPLAGEAPIRVSAAAQTRGTSIARIDLYLNDRRLQTLYELPQARIELRIGAHTVPYTMPRGANLQQLLEGLAKAVNDDADLARANGVKAVPQVSSGTLQLVSRTPGAAGNGIPVAVKVTSEIEPAPVTATVGAGTLAGGGVGPSSARGTLTFVGRRIKPGDVVTVRIQNEDLAYTVPAGGATLPKLLDELVARILGSRSLQNWSGVRAYRDPGGMPFIVLEARTPGETGNEIPFQLTVQPVEGSQLRGYPEALSHLMGGQDGSTAKLDVQFALGDAAPIITYPLDTTNLSDGTHYLRAVACDASAAEVQGYTVRAITVRNNEAAPVVSLAKALGPAAGSIDVPVTAGEGVTRVELYVDGRQCGSSDAAPFTVRLPLAGFGYGPHDVWAVGFDADGKPYRSPISTLDVITPPEIVRIMPPYAARTGGTVHRIAGAGFKPGCTVTLNGVPARSVTLRNPNLLEVVSDAGEVGRGAVKVTNPDTLGTTLEKAFEYYTPRVANVRIIPSRDVIAEGKTAQFITRARDQFGIPIDTVLTWDVIGGGSITDAGLYSASTSAGSSYLLRALTPEGKEAARANITVGREKLPGNGWLRQWLVLGAFPDPDYSGLTTPLIEEPTIEPSHGDRTGDLQWRSLHADNNFVDFAGYLTPNTNALAYAHVYLHAPAATACSLVFGANDGIRVWVNGEQIFQQRVRRTAVDPDQNTVGITLRAGWNRLLVKVDQESGGWGFFMRLLAKGGKPLKDITFTLDRPAEPGQNTKPESIEEPKPEQEPEE
ncbi:MAG: TIGR03790 family protein [Armatimonadota bacterium]